MNKLIVLYNGKIYFYHIIEGYIRGKKRIILLIQMKQIK